MRIRKVWQAEKAKTSILSKRSNKEKTETRPSQEDGQDNASVYSKEKDSGNDENKDNSVQKTLEDEKGDIEVTPKSSNSNVSSKSKEKSEETNKQDQTQSHIPSKSNIEGEKGDSDGSGSENEDKSSVNMSRDHELKLFSLYSLQKRYQHVSFWRTKYAGSGKDIRYTQKSKS